MGSCEMERKMREASSQAPSVFLFISLATLATPADISRVYDYGIIIRIYHHAQFAELIVRNRL